MTSTLNQITNFLAINDRVGTAGQPKREQFADIRRDGYELVINLALPTSTNAISDEAAVVAEQGMDYLHIPVVWEKPTAQDLQRFFVALEANRDQKVFVHCAMNMRVSAFMYLYRVLREQLPPEQALQDLHKIWQPIPHWRKFIDDALAAAQR